MRSTQISIIFVLIGFMSYASSSAVPADEQHTSCKLMQVLTPHEPPGANDDPCMDEWPEFDGTPLVSTQVNHNPSLSDDFAGYRDFPRGGPQATNVGLFVFPQYKFAICLIPKVGSSMWNDILLKMIKDDPSATGKMEFMEYSENWRGTAAEKTAFFSDPDTTRAVFVREPLSRFASAFLDKCCSEGAALSVLCPMKEAVDEGTPITMKIAVEWMMQANLSKLNEHWLPQSYFCQLESRVADYSVVGKYSEDKYGDDATCLMQASGLARYNSNGPENNNTLYWTASDRAENAAPNNYHMSTDAQERIMLKRLFTPDAARELIALLHMDYETFNFPREPKWVSLATGSLYDRVLPRFSKS